MQRECIPMRVPDRQKQRWEYLRKKAWTFCGRTIATLIAWSLIIGCVYGVYWFANHIVERLSSGRPSFMMIFDLLLLLLLAIVGIFSLFVSFIVGSELYAKNDVIV